jgi:hypothetical protein
MPLPRPLTICAGRCARSVRLILRAPCTCLQLTSQRCIAAAEAADEQDGEKSAAAASRAAKRARQKAAAAAAAAKADADSSPDAAGQGGEGPAANGAPVDEQPAEEGDAEPAITEDPAEVCLQRGKQGLTFRWLRDAPASVQQQLLQQGRRGSLSQTRRTCHWRG